MKTAVCRSGEKKHRAESTPVTKEKNSNEASAVVKVENQDDQEKTPRVSQFEEVKIFILWGVGVGVGT